jgi:hypothetical protein
MWRSLTMAIGISLCILGGECMVLEKVVMADQKSQSSPVSQTGYGYPPSVRKQILVPPEWAPWTLLSAGAVVVLYSLTAPGTSNE